MYRQIAPDPLELPQPLTTAPTQWEVGPPAPLGEPLTALFHTEPIQVDERERCYAVRSVRGTGATRVESNPSAPVCITPIDIYPPAAPAGLAAVAGEAQISLIWEPNLEADLGGYLVLRREARDATLLPLTERPIADARFTDRSVTPGVQYFYAVVAVDTRVPLPNMSTPSVEAFDTAR